MIRLLGILGALSGALDLGTGAPLDESLARSVVAVRLARAVGCSDDDVRVVLYASLLEHIGCTAASPEAAELFGDDISVVRYSHVADLTRPAEVRGVFVPAVAAASGRTRVRTGVSAVRASRDAYPARATCEVASGAARRLGLGDGVEQALAHVTAQWDGRGYPPVGGDDLPLATRVLHVAGIAVLVALLTDRQRALAEVRRRAGTALDPRLTEALTADMLDEITDDVDGQDPLDLALGVEPDPVLRVDDAALADVSRVFGDVVDLKSPWLHGHSAAVADLAAAAGRALPGTDPEHLRVAGHLHDLGRIAVSGRIWSKRTALTAVERDQARLHPYYTERILARTPVLADIATTAARHHERCDGSGYHRGLRAPDLSLEARLLAAADAYRTAVQAPPDGAAAPPEAAGAAHLTDEARAGRLDPDAVAAVLQATGRPRPARAAGAAGLTDRQVEVLRLVARGLTNREIAARLVISPRTAEHHVQDIYLRTGVSTRAGAALYAMEHGLH